MQYLENNTNMKIKTLFLYLATLLTLASCSEKNTEKPYDPLTQGRLSFELIRNNVYIISSLSEAKTIKVTLLSEEGDTIVLPSLELTGDENLIRTPYIPLDAGGYWVIGYRCFDLQADLIDDLDITIDEDNYVEVEVGEDLDIPLPTYVKKVLTTSNLYNSLQGICLEILGDDESLWPASWDFASGEITIEWAGLEFDTDQFSNPTDVIGFVLDGNPDYIINSDTWEPILVSLPEFKHVKVLPACIVNLTKLQSIVVRNCDLEEIPSEFEDSHITSLTVENTNLASLPSSLARMTDLTDASFIGNKMTEFPECLTGVKTMEMFTIDNERITSVPASISNWGDHLTALNICNTDITSLPDVFDKLWRVSTLNFSGNKHLATLPPSIGIENIPYGNGDTYSKSYISGLNLSRCAFTAIPKAVQRAGILTLDLANNQITSLSSSDLEAMSDLETLILDGNPLSSFPRITNPNLAMLSLIGTGLTREQVDLSGLLKLNPKYVFFTQEDYDKVFK